MSELEMIDSRTCTKCQNCNEWTNYAGDEDYKQRDAYIKALEADNARMVIAALGLVARMDFIHNDAEFQAIWVMAGNRGTPYKGPTYKDELEALRKAVAEIPEEFVRSSLASGMSDKTHDEVMAGLQEQVDNAAFNIETHYVCGHRRIEGDKAECCPLPLCNLAMMDEGVI